MKRTKLQNKLYRDLKQMGVRYAGVYLVNKFFIKINTRRMRSEIPSYDFKRHNFSNEDQITLQNENYPTLFHEYIHYVHEVSTLAGISQFYFNIFKGTIFSHFVELQHPSIAKPISGPMKKIYDGLQINLEFITGGFRENVDDRIIYEVYDILFESFPAYEPADNSRHMIEVPVVYYNYVEKKTNKQKQDCVIFGKLFLYEGLAHSLDQITTDQGGGMRTPQSQIGPEYRMLAMVAQKIFPTIDERSLLELASMSLSFFNCGNRFIRTLEEAATVPHMPGYVFEIQNQVHAHLSSQRKGIKATLQQIKNTFRMRRELFLAASHLCKVMLEGYDQRIKNPVFEIDVTFNHQQHRLREYVDLCQMLYEFADDDDVFMRDFAGSYLPGRLGKKLLTFMCHVDYAQRPVTGNAVRCCPLYTFCPQNRRKEKPTQCSTQPWLAWDDQPEYGWCEYALGVGYMSGHEQPKIKSRKKTI